MSKRDLGSVSARRASVAVEGLLVLLVLVVAAWLPTPAPPSYVAHATVLLVTEPAAANPLSGGLIGPQDLLVQEMSSRATHARLRAAGLTGGYAVVRESNTPGPVLRVTVSDRGQRQTTTDLRRMITELRKTLRELERKARISSRQSVQILLLEPPSRPTRVTWTERLFGGKPLSR